MQPCPLCQKTETQLCYEEKRRPFYKCESCFLVFVPKEFHISELEERKRYDLHENDLSGSNYQGYKSWMRDFWSWMNEEKLQGSICDYGSGPHPILAEIEKDEGLNLNFSFYDYYYAPESKPTEKSLDVIILSEVIEHFRDPHEEWTHIAKLLKNKARLCIRTSLWNEETRWMGWAYARDNTHINFYHQKTFEYLAKEYNWSLSRLDKDKIELKKGSKVKEKIRSYTKAFKRELKIYRLLLKDERTPFVAKLLLALAVGYVLLPFDLIPDFIPVVGQIDDIIVVPLLVYLSIKIIPKKLVDEYRSQVNL